MQQGWWSSIKRLPEMEWLDLAEWVVVELVQQYREDHLVHHEEFNPCQFLHQLLLQLTQSPLTHNCCCKRVWMKGKIMLVICVTRGGAASLWQQSSSSQQTTPSQTPSFHFLERSQSVRRQSHKTMAIQKGQHKVLFNIGQVRRRRRRRRRILLQTSSFENSTTFLFALNFHMQLIPRLYRLL
jgi:hypothetical protein